MPKAARTAARAARPPAELAGAGAGAGQTVEQQLPGSHSQVEVSQRSGMGSGQLKQQGLSAQHLLSPGSQKQEGGPRHRGVQSVGAKQNVQPGPLTLNISLSPGGQRPLGVGGCACAEATSTSRSTVATAILDTVTAFRIWAVYLMEAAPVNLRPVPSACLCVLCGHFRLRRSASRRPCLGRAVIDEAHRGGDGRWPALLGDQAVHALGDAAIGGMALRRERSSIRCIASRAFISQVEADAVGHRQDVRPRRRAGRRRRGRRCSSAPSAHERRRHVRARRRCVSTISAAST